MAFRAQLAFLIAFSEVQDTKAHAAPALTSVSKMNTDAPIQKLCICQAYRAGSKTLIQFQVIGETFYLRALYSISQQGCR